MNRILLVLLALGAVGVNTALSTPLDGRIVGGENADIRQHPYQISMRYNGRHRCGGSIFASNIIISAAHCVEDLANASNLTIVAGSTRISQKQHEIPVREFIVHKQYRSINFDYDVTILVLDGDFVFSEYIQPIKLATERAAAGSLVTITGWGTLESGGSLPDVLQKVQVNIVDNSKCKSAYSVMLTSRMLCAAVEGGGKDTCQGDSGGPLVYNNQLLGIVSWGWGCAKKSVPGIYASVPDLRDWILKVRDSFANVGSIQFL